MKTIFVMTAATALLATGCSSKSQPSTDNPTATPSQPAVKKTVFEGNPGVARPASEIVYKEMAPFVKFGPGAGNMSEGAHGTFGVFPGMASSPPHTHSKSYHGVVLAGVMENPFGMDKKHTQLTAGSHWHVPAGDQHITRCVSEEPCRFYFHAESAFDFTPLESISEARSGEAVSLAASDLEWKQIAPFVEMASAFGNMGEGAHGTFGRFPANTSSPKHTHTGDYQGVVIQGTMINPFGGDENPPEMGPGSFWEVTGSAPHRTACVSDTPCLFYFHSKAKFDFAPAE